MEWLRIITSNEFMRVATIEIVYVRANGNYCDLMLTSGRCHTMTFQLHCLEDAFEKLHNNYFIRVGRSLIVNRRYVHIINLTEQLLVLSGQAMREPIVFSGVERKDRPNRLQLSRENLKELWDKLKEEKGGIYE